jgi:hypothetical protein
VRRLLLLLLLLELSPIPANPSVEGEGGRGDRSTGEKKVLKAEGDIMDGEDPTDANVEAGDLGVEGDNKDGFTEDEATLRYCFGVCSWAAGISCWCWT